MTRKIFTSRGCVDFFLVEWIPCFLILILQSLIHSEIEEITHKIQALDGIRARLEQDLLKLQEEELELDDECMSNGSLFNFVLIRSDSGGCEGAHQLRAYHYRTR